MIAKSYGINCNERYSLVQTLMAQMKTDLTYFTSKFIEYSILDNTTMGTGTDKKILSWE